MYKIWRILGIPAFHLYHVSLFMYYNKYTLIISSFWLFYRQKSIDMFLLMINNLLFAYFNERCLSLL